LAETESITNIHRRLTNVYGDMAVDKAPSAVGQSDWHLQNMDRAMCLISRARTGVILIDVLHRDQTINSDVYVETLKKRFQRVRPHKGVTDVLLHHDSSRPHTSLHTRKAITDLQWTVLPHPSYSPDLAPSDYHLFSPLKDAIRGKKFENDEEVISEVKTDTCRVVPHISVA
jgi:histone-lysine N-methyltransferase SETMAR